MYIYVCMYVYIYVCIYVCMYGIADLTSGLLYADLGSRRPFAELLDGRRSKSIAGPQQHRLIQLVMQAA